LSAFTDVLHEMGRAEEPLSLATIADHLERDPRDVIAAISVLESQGLVVRVRTLYGLSRLGRRTAPRAPAAVG
jgi:predicted transcriptional regulator